MSARDNILAKLRKANAYPMAEPQTFDYYQEMSPEWESETARLRHWATTMRAVKTEIFWVRENDWEQKLVEVAQQKGLRATTSHVNKGINMGCAQAVLG